MQLYQDKPHTQLGFIFNLAEHWFTLRRFGPADADISKDEGIGHWFNLNSFLPDPEWVSRTYLGMVIQQAETEGQSTMTRYENAK
jgi:Ataxin-3